MKWRYGAHHTSWTSGTELLGCGVVYGDKGWEARVVIGPKTTVVGVSYPTEGDAKRAAEAFFDSQVGDPFEEYRLEEESWSHEPIGSLDSLFRFKVGDIVTLRASVHPFPLQHAVPRICIVQRMTVTCTAGTQMVYEGRVITAGGIGQGYVQFNEVELCEIPEELRDGELRSWRQAMQEAVELATKEVKGGA